MSEYINGRQDAYSDLIHELQVNLHDMLLGEERKYTKNEIINLVKEIKESEVDD